MQPETRQGLAPAKRLGLVGIVGAAAAAILMQLEPSNEGTVYRTYKDLGGVLTYCTGATEDAIAGKVYTASECAARLDLDLAEHAAGVRACLLPVWDRLTVGQIVAFVDTAYNVGVKAFCGSSMTRFALAGNMAQSCAALSLWVKVGGKTIQGLVNRRVTARAFCEGRK